MKRKKGNEEQEWDVLKIDVRTNFPQVRHYIESVGKQARFATAVALTRTAQDVKAEERKAMPEVLDRPTPYTLNSLFLSPATKDRLEAQVWLKDDRAGSGTPATRYLLPEIEGGPRGLKGFERALQAHGLMQRGLFAVPGAGVRLDHYGNVPKGLLVQILSQLRVQMTAGFESRATGSARSKRNVAKQGVVYFALQKQHGKLKPGIYARVQRKGKSTVRPIFVYATRARYKPRFHFYAIAGRVIDERFPEHFSTEFSKALRTAR